MPFTIGKQFLFEAAHHLPNHDGKCRAVHGHSYLVEVVIAGPRLETAGSSEGMLVDFGVISDAMKQIINKLDHSDLNETVSGKDGLPPTAENIAYEIFKELQWLIQGPAVLPPARLQEVRVWETGTCWAAYSEE